MNNIFNLGKVLNKEIEILKKKKKRNVCRILEDNNYGICLIFLSGLVL